jgi:hypothetical protein
MRDEYARVKASAAIPPRRVLAGIGIVLLAFVLVSAYLVSKLDPTPHVVIFDELAAAGSWDLVHADEGGPGTIFGSAAQRWYLADADPDELVASATEKLSAAGFTINVYNRRSACLFDAFGSPTECFVNAKRGDDEVSVHATDRGQTVDYYVGSEAAHVGAQDRIVVVVTVTY